MNGLQDHTPGAHQSFRLAAYHVRIDDVLFHSRYDAPLLFSAHGCLPYFFRRIALAAGLCRARIGSSLLWWAGSPTRALLLTLAALLRLVPPLPRLSLLVTTDRAGPSVTATFLPRQTTPAPLLWQLLH